MKKQAEPAPKEGPRKLRHRYRMDRVWTDAFYFKAYELARSGLSDTRIASALGVQYRTFMAWKEKRPALVEALASARSSKDAIRTFKEYVYEQLPPEVKGLWNELERIDKEKSGPLRVEAMLEGQGIRVRQHLFIHALISCNFNASEACRMVNLDRSTLDQWTARDRTFAKLLEEVNWHKGNFFEGGLIKLCKAGDTSAILFANRTFNKDRGYGDSTQVDVNITGKVVHAHTDVDLEDLELEPRVMRKMLKALRKKRREGDQPDDETNGRALPEHVEDADYEVVDSHGG